MKKKGMKYVKNIGKVIIFYNLNVLWQGCSRLCSLRFNSLWLTITTLITQYILRWIQKLITASKLTCVVAVFLMVARLKLTRQKSIVIHSLLPDIGSHSLMQVRGTHLVCWLAYHCLSLICRQFSRNIFLVLVVFYLAENQVIFSDVAIAAPQLNFLVTPVLRYLVALRTCTLTLCFVLKC